VALVALFAYGTIDEFTTPPRTVYRVIAGVMMLVGFLVFSIVAWKQYKGGLR